MTKHLLITPENPNGILSDLTTEETNQRNLDAVEFESLKEIEENKKKKKESGKAKLKAAEALTDDEIKALFG